MGNAAPLTVTNSGQSHHDITHEVVYHSSPIYCSFRYLLALSSKSSSLCETPSTASKLSTYMLKMASYFNTNLFSNWMNINKLEAVTVSFAGMELF